jgi:hypothetical protein
MLMVFSFFSWSLFFQRGHDGLGGVGHGLGGDDGQA